MNWHKWEEVLQPKLIIIFNNNNLSDFPEDFFDLEELKYLKADILQLDQGKLQHRQNPKGLIIE